MTKIATASFDTQKVDAPTDGSTLGGYAVSLLLAGALIGTPTVVADNTTPVAMTISTAGNYTVQVARLLQDNVTIFGAVVSSAPFDVPQDQVDVPLTVTITLSDPA